MNWATLHPFFESGDILGRGVANAGFLRALLKADPFAKYSFFLANMGQVEGLAEVAKAEFSGLEARGAFEFKLLRDLPAALRGCEYHCFHLSDWVSQFTALARLRNYLAKDIFPITGVTHSLSYARYAPEILGHLWGGVTERDAVIATSRCGVGVMERAFAEARAGYTLSPEAFKAPQLRRIPLGIDDNPALAPDAAKRAAARAAHGFAPDEVVCLVVGRISHYSKMDLLPVLRALQRLKSGGFELAGVRLVIAGWTRDDDDTPVVLSALAKGMGLKLTVAARPTDAERDSLYRAADIFLSPSDNVQETFGLTILEAGLAGLPVIASDYDGYKDTVLHEKTGLLIPVICPSRTEYTDILAHLWYDSEYHLRLAQQTALSVPRLAEGLAELIADRERRETMGRAAREHVLKSYVWDKIIAEYLALWEELRARPIEREALRGIGHPLQFSFARLFEAYGTSELSGDLRVIWSRAGEALYRGKEAPVYYGGMEEFIVEPVLRKMLFQARKSVSVADLRAGLRAFALSGEEADFYILWALKHDFLEAACEDA